MPLCLSIEEFGNCYITETGTSERKCYYLKENKNASMRLQIDGSFLVVPFSIIFMVVSAVGLIMSIRLDENTVSKPLLLRGHKI